MRLHFDDCAWLRDFEAWRDVPRGWVDGWDDPANWQVWFKAYDCQQMTCETETDYWERGYGFRCLVNLVCDPIEGNGVYAEWVLGEFPARDVCEAERLLQVAADALYGKERA